MIGKIILIVILILVALLVSAGTAGLTPLPLSASGDDPDHENSVNVPRGTTMETTRTTNISRTGKK